MEKYRSTLNHKPSISRGLEITGQELASKRSIILKTLPTSMDFRITAPFACYDQGNLGSCTANAVAGAVQYLKPDIMMSRLYNYYWARSAIGSVGEDSGAYVSDAVGVTVNKGIPRESLWPYDISKYTQRPPSNAEQEAATRKSLRAQALSNSLSSVKAAIASGVPVIIGFAVYSSMFGSSCMATGNIPMPGPGETMEGGHCVAIWGYNDTTQKLIIRNSWNTDVGDNGYFYMPYSYFNAYAWDFWVIYEISDLSTSEPPSLVLTNSTFRVKPEAFNCNFSLTNNDTSSSKISLTAVSSPSGLGLAFAKKDITLASVASTDTYLRITPNKSSANKSYTITITATSNSTSLTSTCTVTVNVLGLSLSIAPVFNPTTSLQTISKGTSKNFDIVLTNNDLYAITNLIETVLPTGITSSISPNNFTLAPGANRTFRITLTVADSVTSGNYAVLFSSTEKTSKLRSVGGFILTVS